MPETRRELFRTSIVAAVGLSIGAFVGYEVGEAVYQTVYRTRSTSPLAGSVIAVWGQNPAGQSSWYFFVFDANDASKCQLWSTGTPYPSAAPPSKINVVDTYNWYLSLSAKSQIVMPTTLQYTMYDGSSGSFTVAFTPGGYLDPNSLSNLLGLMSNTNAYTQTGASWNEIGKQHN